MNNKLTVGWIVSLLIVAMSAIFVTRHMDAAIVTNFIGQVRGSVMSLLEVAVNFVGKEWLDIDISVGHGASESAASLGLSLVLLFVGISIGFTMSNIE